jgi:general secretion pathway protein G
MGATRQHPQPSFASRHRWAISRPAGFTLLEILLALAIVAVTAAMAIPSYERYRERVRTAQAVNDIANMGTLIARFATDSRAVPETLDEVGLAGKLDPWGRPYRYLNLTTKGGKGGARKDKKLNPLNSDFDLYSKGRDGKSASALTAKISQDDVIRANNGGYIGLASDY